MLVPVHVQVGQLVNVILKLHFTSIVIDQLTNCMFSYVDCLCDPLGTTTGTNCDGVTGECTCKTGYTDRDCSKCDDLYFKESSGTCASKFLAAKPKFTFSRSK